MDHQPRDGDGVDEEAEDEGLGEGTGWYVRHERHMILSFITAHGSTSRSRPILYMIYCIRSLYDDEYMLVPQSLWSNHQECDHKHSLSQNTCTAISTHSGESVIVSASIRNISHETTGNCEDSLKQEQHQTAQIWYQKKKKNVSMDDRYSSYQDDFHPQKNNTVCSVGNETQVINSKTTIENQAEWRNEGTISIGWSSHSLIVWFVELAPGFCRRFARITHPWQMKASQANDKEYTKINMERWQENT
jgi:hypothetical protein